MPITLVVDKDNKKAQYKDYVNFLGNYKNGKRDECDNGGLVKSFSPEVSELPTKSFNEYLLSYSNKSFHPVQPTVPENPRENKKKQKNIKTELVIQINADKSEDLVTTGQSHVTDIAEIFENEAQIRQNKNIKPENEDRILKTTTKVNSYKRNTTNNRPVNAFSYKIKQSNEESSTHLGNLNKNISLQGISKRNNNFGTSHVADENKEKSNNHPIVFFEKLAATAMSQLKNDISKTNSSDIPKSSQVQDKNFEIDTKVPPAPPLPPANFSPSKEVLKPPQYKSYTLPRLPSNSPNLHKDKVDSLKRNDPRVKKLVYESLRNMYGSYHDKANDYLVTLPKNRVKKQNGLDSIIDSIAAQGGLEKLCGRAKVEVD